MITEDNKVDVKGNSLLMKCVDEILGILSGKNIILKLMMNLNL